jgi:hypothetical protein
VENTLVQGSRKYTYILTSSIRGSMNSAFILTGLFTLLTAASIALSPVLASLDADYLQLNNTFFELTDDGIDVKFTADAEIPQGIDAVGKAFGYGLLTSEGTNAVIVTTTHSGYLDSVAQNGNAIDPVWHNHFVKLGPLAQCSGISANSTGMIEITFDEGGDVEINDGVAELADVPLGIIKGREVLTNTSPFEIYPGNDVQNAISFNLVPVLEGGSLQAVCVDDIGTFTAVEVRANITGPGGLIGGNMTGGNMTGGNMTGGNMTGGNMTGGNMTGGNMTGPGGLTGGNMTGGNMTGGNMTVISVTGAPSDGGSDGNGDGDDNDGGNDDGDNN